MTTGLIISIVAVGLLLYIIIKNRRKPLPPFGAVTDDDRRFLERFVTFYRNLEPNNRLVFETRLSGFLSTTKVTGVKTKVERMDELLVASSAIIPVFYSSRWQYINIKEVLLYPGSFDSWFNQDGEDRTRAGIVGDGPLQDVMVLSQPELRAGYFNPDTCSNTGIHEFVHLVDKTDGAIDGLPENLLPEQYHSQWMAMVQYHIQQVRMQQSEIDAYGGTNRAEFFAVISEYFFKQPHRLHAYHPDLYEMLARIYGHSLQPPVDVYEPGL